MKLYITNNTGAGKTSLGVYLAYKYRYEFKASYNNPIYSTIKLNIPNSIYTPYMLLPYSKILKGKCLILIDDIVNLKNANPIIELLAILSRKTDIDIIITSQYDKIDVEKKIRQLCHFHIKVELQGKKIKDSDFYEQHGTNLIQYIFLPDDKVLQDIKVVKDIFVKINGLFDTNEVPPRLTDRIKKQEILSISNDIETLEFNCDMLYRDKRKALKVLKELMEIKGFDYNEYLKEKR